MAQRLASRSSMIAQQSGFLSANDRTALSPLPRSQDATLGLISTFTIRFHAKLARIIAVESIFPFAIISLLTASGITISLNNAGRRSAWPLLDRQIKGEASTTTRSIGIAQ